MGRNQQVFQRFLHFIEKSREPVKVPVTVEGPLPQPRQTKEPAKPMYEELTTAVPKTYRQNTRRQLGRLKESERVTWSDDGRVNINGKEVPNTTIIDLLNHVLRPRKRSNTEGWPEFTGVLKEINISTKCIGNPTRKKNSHHASDARHQTR